MEGKRRSFSYKGLPKYATLYQKKQKRSKIEPVFEPLLGVVVFTHIHSCINKP